MVRTFFSHFPSRHKKDKTTPPDVTSSDIVQKYLALRSEGEAHVSRSSSLVNLLNHRSSQLQWSGLPPKLKTREVSGEPLDLA